MWWIIGAFCVLSVLAVLAACKVSGDISRKEDENSKYS